MRVTPRLKGLTTEIDLNCVINNFYNQFFIGTASNGIIKR